MSSKVSSEISSEKTPFFSIAKWTSIRYKISNKFHILQKIVAQRKNRPEGRSFLFFNHFFQKKHCTVKPK